MTQSTIRSRYGESKKNDSTLLVNFKSPLQLSILMPAGAAIDCCLKQ